MKSPSRVQIPTGRQRFQRAAAIALLSAACAAGQQENGQQSRIGFYGATVSTVHFFNPNRDPYALSYSPLWSLGNDTLTTGSASVGGTWARRGEVVEVLYTPSYTRSSLYPESSRLNHSFSLHGLGDRGIRLSPRLRLAFGANAAISDFQHFLLTPTSFSRVALSGSSANDLAEGVLQGKFTDPELAGALTGTAVLESPTRLLLFGNRMLSATARTALTYNYSPRLYFSFHLAGMRAQHLNLDRGASVDNRYILPHSTFGLASVAVGYSLSPRSHIGFSAGAGRTFSELQHSWSTSARVTYGRRMGPNWFFNADAGAGRIYAPRTRSGDLTHVIGGATLGYSIGRHTFIANGNRALSEELGAGSGTGISARAAWSWQLGHTSWRLYADGSRQTWTRESNPTLASWRTSAGVGRRLPAGLFWNAGLYYITLSGSSFGGPSRIALGAFRTTISWAPDRFFLK